MSREIIRPNRLQYTTARAITGWYLNSYFGKPEDVGVPKMFCRKESVGHFAVDPNALAAGEGDALFRLLVTMTMFQRRSDRQIMRVLKSISQESAREITDADVLLNLSDSIDCPNASSLAILKERCDLAKDPESKKGICRARPDTPCHLKRHTELLKRYGHFGKVPTSAALVLRESKVASLAELKNNIWEITPCPKQRAKEIERAISRSWRVSEKIAAMFLSAVTNSDLSADLAPWSEGVDSSHFVVIDSNVDLFLKATGYKGPMSYSGRREFIQTLSKRVRLDEFRPKMQGYNPRIVQQAFYMFMSESNRMHNDRDCSNAHPPVCDNCPSTLSRICSRRRDH